MKCRKNIIGHIIWNDNDNFYNWRPLSLEITLLRDGEPFKSLEADTSAAKTRFIFPCLLRYSPLGVEYNYSLLISNAPVEYIMDVNGFEVLFTISEIEIEASKKWNDRNNLESIRPPFITVHLLQNETVFRSIEVESPIDSEDTSTFTFSNLPFADSRRVPYDYRLDESEVSSYTKRIEKYTIINDEIIL